MDRCLKPKRIVVKLGTNILTRGGKNQLDIPTISQLVDQIAYLTAKGNEILVITSGAVTAGKKTLFKKQSKINLSGKKISFKQGLAAIGQPELMMAYKRLFEKHNLNVGQILITRTDLDGRKRYLNFRNTLETLLSSGVIPIINENDAVAVDELAGDNFGDNDRLSVLVANAIDAELLILLGEVEGYYSDDPFENSHADLVPQIDEITDQLKSAAKDSHDGIGSGGMKSKIDAGELAMDSGIPMYIASGYVDNVLIDISNDIHVGTLFKPKVSRREARKRWILTGRTEKTGRLVIDNGAYKALKYGGNSLLPTGIIKISKPFVRGDIIEVIKEDETTVAWGITNYDSTEVEQIKGKKSESVENILGHFYGSEIVHRNNMSII